jgi:hypothetical protein
MTKPIDELEDAIDEAIDDLADVPVWCGRCSRYGCRDHVDKSQRLRAAWTVLGDRYDGRTLRLDSKTISTILHPRFPRFGITACDSDADVISEVINLGLSCGTEAAAIVWHMAQGRPDQDDLAQEADDRWGELQQLARELAS